MPHRLLHDPLFALLLIAFGGGALGGAGVAAIHTIRGRRLSIMLILSYIVFGAVIGILFYLVAPFIGLDNSTPDGVLRGSIFMAFMAVVVLASRDLGFRFTIKQLGLRGKIEIYKPSDVEQDGNEKN